jgi:trimeric autotransporter adhesin
MEASMNSITRLVAVVAGLVCMFHSTSTSGGTINPTASDANFNTAGGTNALQNLSTGTCGSTAGCSNTAFGYEALDANTTGSDNTACGAFTLINNTTGGFNTAVGSAALESNDLGEENTATGASALISNTGGNMNTANGALALITNTTGSDNTASGASALFHNDTGNNNTAVGVEALGANVDGAQNTAVGGNALLNNVDGTANTAVGFKALKKSTGTKNIGIGYQAGVTLINGNNNIYIGNQGAGDEFQTIRIGTAQAQTFIAGIVTAGVDGATVQVDGNGQLGIAPSSARYKQDIAPMGPSSERVLQLNPVTFAYKEDVQHVTHYGLIAEEVEKVYPELVTHTATGEVQTVKYQELIPMLLNELQRQRQAFQQESAEVAMLRKELADLRALVGQGRETASLAR